MNNELNVIAGIAGKVFNCFTEMILRGPKRGREEELQRRLPSALSGLGQPSSHRNIMHSSLTFKKKIWARIKHKTNKEKTLKSVCFGWQSHKTSSQQWVIKKRWKLLMDQLVKPQIRTASMKTTVQMMETRDPSSSNSKALVRFL